MCKWQIVCILLLDYCRLLCSYVLHILECLMSMYKKLNSLCPYYLLTYLLTCLLTYLLTYLLTPSSRVLEKLTGSQLVKFPAFYGTQRFLIVYTSAHHLSVSWAKSVQSMLPHCTSWRSILMLSSTYARVIQVFSFPQVSTPKPWQHLSSSLYMLHASPISSCIWSLE